MATGLFWIVYSLFVRLSCEFLLLLDDVVGDAEGVTEVERVSVFVKDFTSVIEEGLLCGCDVLDREAWDGGSGVEVAVDVEQKVAGVILERSFGAAQQLELHHVGVEVFSGGDVFEMNGHAVIGFEHFGMLLRSLMLVVGVCVEARTYECCEGGRTAAVMRC